MDSAELTEESVPSTAVDDPVTEIPTLDELVPEADEPATPISDISLEEPPQESEPIEIDLDSNDSNDSNALVGSDEEIGVMASMDIDAELADIEELEDTSESISEAAQGELTELNVGDDIAVSTDEEVVVDIEPVDELELEPVDELELGPVDELEVGPIDELDLSDGSAIDLSPELDLSADPELPADPVLPAEPASPPDPGTALPDNLKSELRSVLSYMDQLLESLPEEKIQEFAQSDHFTVYRRLFEELGLEQ
jgi:hypothetical protein